EAANLKGPIHIAGHSLGGSIALLYAGQTPKVLSGGEQQRVAIARALIAEPQIIFADEPTGNLDGQTAQEIETLLFDLNRELGTTLILVTHDRNLAALCQRHVELDDGRLKTVQGG
ncbi:ATP-binding cassette domain-containing protein, partial [Acinetobacter baumannii]